MRIDAITLFPEMFDAVSRYGISGRALKKGLCSLKLWNPRDVTFDLHRTVDDRPFGGGPGMVLMAEPLYRTLELIRASGNRGRVVAFSPAGTRLDDPAVLSMARAQEDLVLVCGRYEGIDQRFLDCCVDRLYSVGDYVLSGAELPAMSLIDAVVRRLPGAIKELSASDESFSTGLLDGGHYTRPEVWHGLGTPEVLLSGHHANIARYEREQSLALTARQRPDLIESARAQGLLDKKDESFLKTLPRSGEK